MMYCFEQIQDYLQKLLEKHCEPELSLWIEGQEYMIILYSNFCSFHKIGADDKIMEFASLDELYSAKVHDGIVLKNDWDRVTKIECIDFDYLQLPTEMLS